METNAQDDLKYLRQVAEQGEKQPVHGGEFGILWGTLYFVASLYAYATLSGLFSFPNSTVVIAFALPIEPIVLRLRLNKIESVAFKSRSSKKVRPSFVVIIRHSSS